MFFIASSIGSGWVLFLSVCVLSSCMLSFILPLILLRSLRMHLSAPEQVTSGDRFSMTLRFEQSWSLALLRFVILQVVDGSAPGREKLSEAFLLERLSAGSAAKFEVLGLKRGFRKIPALTLETSFPFGMVWVKVQFDAEKMIAVFPRTEPVEGRFLYRLRSGEFVPGGSQNSGSGYQSCSARGVRKYVRGDSRRHMHWSLSARHGQLMVRELEKEGMPVFDLAFDLSSSWQNAEQFELAVTAAASILKLGHNLGVHPDLYLLESRQKGLGAFCTDIEEQLMRLCRLDFNEAKKNLLSETFDFSCIEGRSRALLLISSARENLPTDLAEARAALFCLLISDGESAIASGENQLLLSGSEGFADL
ncbi:MAG: DUF58 domain-containing protein [Candidatus Obscuribacterales bacterium]|nr:DUF58 domain-containing protein [Candidatus Obscuribacterales bacterium]